MKFSYVLPDPGSYQDWTEFEDDLACLKQAGYDAVELQITDPADLDELRLNQSLKNAGYTLCAFQTGSTYYTRGNCLSASDPAVRERTFELLKSFVNLAQRFNSIIVFGSLQGRKVDEPDLEAGRRKIVDAMTRISDYATQRKVSIALEPVNHLEVAYHHTIYEVSELVRMLNQPSLKMMIDTFHMNIEEKDMLAPLSAIKDILIHVHLSETNRNVLGEGHLDTRAFLNQLQQNGYGGFCSVGVYNSRLSQQKCIMNCMEKLKSL